MSEAPPTAPPPSRSGGSELALALLVVEGYVYLLATILVFVGLIACLVWGVLAFAFNYIPYIGSFVASVPPTIIAFVQFGFGWGSWLTLAVLLLNQLVWDNFLTPRLEGQRLDLSPLLIVIGLAYFGLVWGVIGMVLSVPLLLGVRELLTRFDSTRALAQLMTTGQKPKKASAR